MRTSTYLHFLLQQVNEGDKQAVKDRALEFLNDAKKTGDEHLRIAADIIYQLLVATKDLIQVCLLYAISYAFQL